MVPIKGDYKEMIHNRPTKTEINEKKIMLRLQHNNWKRNGLNHIFENDNIYNNVNNKFKINYKIILKKKLNNNSEIISISF